MNLNPQEILGPVGNYSLYAKKIFLTFLQAWFSQDTYSRYLWKSDYKTTKILIFDRFAYDTTRTDARPAIIISRGPFEWANLTLGQITGFDLIKGVPVYGDLLPMGVTLTCISKNGIEAEELATIVMNSITAHKTTLRQRGVFRIARIVVGAESKLMSDVHEVISAVAVDVRFFLMGSIALKQKFYPLTIKYTALHKPETVDSTPNPYWETSTRSWFELTQDKTFDVTLTEGEDYDITISGLLSFNDPPPAQYYIVEGELSTNGPNDGTLPALGSSEGLLSPGYLPYGEVAWTAYYTRADTLESATYVVPADGTETEFALPGGIYGYGTLFQSFTLSGEVA